MAESVVPVLDLNCLSTHKGLTGNYAFYNPVLLFSSHQKTLPGKHNILVSVFSADCDCHQKCVYKTMVIVFAFLSADYFSKFPVKS